MRIESRFYDYCQRCRDIVPDVVMTNIYKRSGNAGDNTIAVSCKLAEACPTIDEEVNDESDISEK